MLFLVEMILRLEITVIRKVITAVKNSIMRNNKYYLRCAIVTICSNGNLKALSIQLGSQAYKYYLL